MVVKTFETKAEMAGAAADHAAESIRRAIAEKGRARIIVATAGSQIEFIEALVAKPGIEWSKVEVFHLDEYQGLSAEHPASFRRFLLERLVRKTGIVKYHLLDGDKDPDEVCRRVGKEISSEPVDVAFVGIGENGHLAFNEPPADFDRDDPYFVVELDEVSRRQQVGEGWFPTLEDVPKKALSMSVKQVLQALEILAIVADARKAPAVRACVMGEVTPNAPASVLRRHPAATLFLDKGSASLLDGKGN
ncbi:MAG: glucosamine-6-phosphate deaminase [Acidobacteria bacterium]|nr:MAG: glucosamine-6-phosphate deaminase [Acidobacteriota bacterium]